MAMIYGVPLLLGSVGSYFVGNMLEELKTEPEPQAQSSWFGGPEQPEQQFGGPAQYPQQPQAQSSWFGGPAQQPQAQSSWFGGPAQQPQAQSSWFGGPAQYPQQPQTQSSWFGGPAQYPQHPQAQSSWFGGPAQYPQQPQAQSSWFGNQQQFREDAYREALQQTTKKADAAEKQVREANAAIMTAQRNQDAAALESAQRSRSEAQAELLSVKQEMARQASEVAAKTAEAEKRARAADQMILDARRENDQAALEEAKKARQAAEEEKMTMAKELQELKAAAAKQPVSVATPITEPPPALPFVQPSPPPVVEPTPATPKTLLDEILGITPADQIEEAKVKEEQVNLTPAPGLQAPAPATPVERPAAPVEPTATPVVQAQTTATPVEEEQAQLTPPPPVIEAQPTATPVVQAPAVSTPSDSGPLFAKPTPNEQQREQLFAKAKLNPELKERYRPDNDVVAMMRQKAEATAAEAEAEAAAERFRQAGIPEQNPFEDQREPAEIPPPPAEQPQSDGWIPMDINNMGTGVYILPGLFGAAGATYIPTIYKFFNQPKMKDNINVSDEDKLAKIADAQTSMRTYLESLKGKMAVSTGKAKDDIASLGKEAVNTFKILLDNFKSEEQTAKRRKELETRQGKITEASDKRAAIIELSRKKTAQLSSDLDNLITQLPAPGNVPNTSLGPSTTRRIANPISQEIRGNKNRSTRRR